MQIISIIIPCYNEEKNIDLLYEELEKIRKKLNYDFEYLFINDGSKDKTTEKIIKLSNDKRVKLIDFSRNFGKEAAILAGLDSSDSDAAIVIDADLQMPVKYICDMINEWEKGYKLVLTYKEKRRKGIKNYMAKKYYSLYNILTRGDILPNALDFQLMDREVVETICTFREKNRFFKGLTGIVGYDYSSIAVNIEDRKYGNSSFSSFKQLFSYAVSSLVPHSIAPLIIGIYLGVFSALFGLVYLVYTVCNTIIYDTAGSGYSTIVSLILFFFGVVLVVLGIIGYYIGMIYEEVKGRPNYIISKKINF